MQREEAGIFTKLATFHHFSDFFDDIGPISMAKVVVLQRRKEKASQLKEDPTQDVFCWDDGDHLVRIRNDKEQLSAIKEGVVTGQYKLEVQERCGAAKNQEGSYQALL